MAFFKKDDFYKSKVTADAVEVSEVEDEEVQEEVTADAISMEADDIRVTSLLVSILRGILKNANAWKHDNLVEYIATLTDDDELAENIIGDVEIILETLLGDNPNASEAVENVINGEDDEYINGLDVVDGAIEDDIDIETLVASYGYFIKETLDSVEEFEVDDDEEVTLDSTAFATMKKCKSGKFNPSRQKCYKSSEYGHKAFRRETKGKKLRPHQKNHHAKGKPFTSSEKKAQRKSMQFLGFWDAKGNVTDKFKKKMGLRKRKDGTWGKPKSKSSTKKTSKSNRG